MFDDTKLVTTNVFMDYLVDKDTGAPLSGGTVSLYEDNNRTVYKNWYYQTGNYPSYSFALLPNPLTLSAIGTVVDDNGNNVLPFFYPFDEAATTYVSQKYYIKVENSNGVEQFTLQGFPYTQSETPSPSATGNTFKNYLVNNQFWRNIQNYDADGNPVPISLDDELDLVVAPSQHDGFAMPDIHFIKDQAGATETLTFGTFPGTAVLINPPDVTPEFYIAHNCTVVGTETYKFYQFPLSYHLLTLAGQELTFTIWANENDTNPNNIIGVSFLQSYGTGQESLTNPISVGTFTLNPGWNKYSKVFTLPPVVPGNISKTGDDAWYIQITMPVAKTFNISFTLPSIYIGDLTGKTIQDFTTYDQVDSIINSPRTGDFRLSINSFGNATGSGYQKSMGWVPANDGTIGNNSSGATTRANIDTWPLYNVIWDNVVNFYAPVSGGRGSSASADFIANKPLTLTKCLGRVMQGADPKFTAVNFTITANNVTFSTNIGTNSALTLGSSYSYTAGDAVILSANGGTLPAPLIAGDIYFISSSPAPTGTVVYLSYTYSQAIVGENITLTSNATGSPIVSTNNFFTFASPTALNPGTPVFLSTTGSFPTNLGGTPNYYFIYGSAITSTTFQLSGYGADMGEVGNDAPFSSQWVFPILGVGTGTFTLYSALGQYVGSGSTDQVPSHTHTFSSNADYVIQSVSPRTSQFAESTQNIDVIAPVYKIGNTGSEAVSIMQPTTTVNMYFKL